jgi:hypothetical protein
MGLGEGHGEGSGASDFHHGLFGCLGNPKNCEFKIFYFVLVYELRLLEVLLRWGQLAKSRLPNPD